MTLPEDPEVKAGWGPINLNWLFDWWARDIIERHDEITSEGSFAQESGIPNDVVADNFREQLERRANTPRSGFKKLIARTAGFVVQKVQFLFYRAK